MTDLIPHHAPSVDIFGGYVEFTAVNRSFRILISGTVDEMREERDDYAPEFLDIRRYNRGVYPLDREAPDTWVLVLAKRRLSLIIRGDLLVLPEDELALMRCEDLGAANLYDFRGIILPMPNATLSSYDRTLLSRNASRANFKTGWGRIFSAYVGALDIPTLENIGKDEPGWVMIEQHIMSLLRRAMLGRSEDARAWRRHSGDEHADVHSRGELLFRRICGWMTENYANPEMSSDFVANHFGISPRYIQNLFSKYGKGATFVSFLRERRMRHAWEMLTGIDFIHQNISEICWNCGFSDPVYFGKTFRSYYGMTPGMARKKGLREAVEQG